MCGIQGEVDLIDMKNEVYGVVGSKFELEMEGMGILGDLERQIEDFGFGVKFK